MLSATAEKLLCCCAIMARLFSSFSRNRTLIQECSALFAKIWRAPKTFSRPFSRHRIAIGEVSGKGIGAALLMASLQASLRAQALHPRLDLTTLIGDVNRLVHDSSPSNFFASLFYAEYEPGTRTLPYVNAGHNPPIVVRPREGACELFRLSAEAVPVGILADARFEAAKFQLMEDDILVAYTDGITANSSGDLWGPERLEHLLLFAPA